MQTIFKYNLTKYGKNVVKLPLYASVLSVGLQKDEPVVWALVNTDEVLVDRIFTIIFTGDDLVHFGLYSDLFLGTVQRTDGIVMHIFRDVATRIKGE